MKLLDLKGALIEQFFSPHSGGIDALQSPTVLRSLAEHLKADVSHLLEHEAPETCTSQNPSKAFRRFADGRLAFLTIIEENGSASNALFAALRVGKRVAVVDLTTESREGRLGDLSKVKQALQQAKSLNDEAYFSITNDERPLNLKRKIS